MLFWKSNDVGDLPSQCVHGMVVEVVNSNADEDNHFVKFFGRKKLMVHIWMDKVHGKNVPKPGRKIDFKRSTMPVVLIRTPDGNFRLTELDGGTYGISSLQDAATFTSTLQIYSYYY